MELEPPQPSVPETGEIRPGGRGYLATILIWFGVLLAVTILAWVVLWSCGIIEGAETDAMPAVFKVC
jgi:hypothetical protein